ncbi:AT-rich interactive domain-containing protein 3A isoform X2 [Gorilla gorilla gorilla]|uniref:AT-rich interactive domain-containing protein 3A isoform X2 n=1 Tax=Gorilla gorilla gorilla TaxID=9595 RepID=UPI00244636C0|nr:AT-rich interactive domain-containing protein 3A isoform X2 [Gorilla gorilla gorilla]
MKLQAVMETLLQRQQRARQELEARQQLPPDPPAAPPGRARAAPDEDREPESARMQRAQMAALAAMRAAAAGLGHPASPGGSEDGPPGSEEEDAAREGTPGSPGRGREGPGEEHFEDVASDEDMKPKWEEEEMEEDLGEDEEEEEEDYEDEEEEEDEEGLGPPGPASLGTTALFPRKAQPPQAFRGDGVPRVLGGQERPGPGPAHPGGAAHVAPQLQPPDHGDWTYEEQFKQLYELDGDPKRKEFLDDLFSFMQKRGTPVNRIPIMAKQVLDLFMLYVLVTEKGGLVEVINKKLWREITKGLNLPTSITSAAFTLRTQYMKYLYPYECEKRGLSNPNELQAAIDSNRREGRRQSFGGSLFAYSPGGAHGMLSSPKLPVSSLGLAASTNGSSITPAPKIKKASESRQDSAVNLTGTNGSNSISMSVEINGIMYTGVLFAQPPAPTPTSAPNKGGGGGGSSSNAGGRGGNTGTSGGQAGPAGLSTPSTSTSNNSLP